MKRVVILGRGASIKSTLALHLAEITGLKPNAIPGIRSASSRNRCSPVLRSGTRLGWGEQHAANFF
jgi:hypothetical protein